MTTLHEYNAEMNKKGNQAAEVNDCFVQSKDGTLISYLRSGDGIPLILVGGGLDDGRENAQLAEVLSNDFTVYNYARRGRGQSGDTLPYTVRREVEDIQALMAITGDGACVFGVSSGGALAFTAAVTGLPIAKLAVYETPYITNENMAQSWQGYTKELHRLLENDQHDDALELFMRFAGSDDETIQEAKQSDFWQPLTRLAHTLAYDAACLGDARPPNELSKIIQPVLVLTGASTKPADGMEELNPDFFGKAAERITSLLPNAVRMTIGDASHIPDPSKLATVLVKFFKE